MDAPLQPADSYVERLWNDLSDLEEYSSTISASVLVSVRSAFTKAMILAAGNWLEQRTMQALLLFAKSASSNDALVHLVENRVHRRQFHTLFDWKASNVNSFLGLFGADFKGKALEASSEEIDHAALDFIVLVAERNALAHGSKINDEAQFTSSDVRDKFYNAAGWISWIGQFLMDGQHPSWNPPTAPEPSHHQEAENVNTKAPDLAS